MRASGCGVATTRLHSRFCIRAPAVAANARSSTLRCDRAPVVVAAQVRTSSHYVSMNAQGRFVLGGGKPLMAAFHCVAARVCYYPCTVQHTLVLKQAKFSRKLFRCQFSRASSNVVPCRHACGGGRARATAVGRRRCARAVAAPVLGLCDRGRCSLGYELQYSTHATHRPLQRKLFVISVYDKCTAACAVARGNLSNPFTSQCDWLS